MSVRMLLVLPALLASASSMCISVQSASQWSRQMCRNRACVRETRFSSDSSATVCSHSFQPLNQSVRIPTWSRNIMASVFSVGGGARGAGLVLTGGGVTGGAPVHSETHRKALTWFWSAVDAGQARVSVRAQGSKVTGGYKRRRD